jgi:hypothetical protein
MIVAETFLEPSEQLWAGIPIFMLAVLVFDLTVLRPVRAFSSPLAKRRRWVIGLLAIGAGTALIWGRPGVSPRADWWYPAWTILLFWVIAAREADRFASRRGKPATALLSAVACTFAGGISLMILGRSSAPTDPGLLICAIVGVVIWVALWTHRSYLEPSAVRRGPQRLPTALRATAFALLVVVLLNPVARHKEVTYDRACLLVLLDDSRSMNIRDVVGAGGSEPISRAGALNTALAAHQYEFSRLGREMEVKTYRFATRLAPADQMSVRAQGDYTALGDAIQQAYEGVLQDGRPVAGVLVFSDGASNLAAVAEPSVAGSALAAGHVPVWAVGVGSETPSGQTRSIIPRNLRMAVSVAVMNQLPIAAEFTFVGMQGDRIRVELLLDDGVVDRQRFECSRSSETRQVQFVYVPRVGGLHKVTVRATPERVKLEGEPAELSQFLHVTDEAIRVLYLEGKPRYEGSFLVRALATSRQIRLHKALLASPTDEEVRTVPGGPSGQWQSYHVLLLGDMAPDQLSDAQMKLIRKHVGDDGCGLAILGGRGLLGTGALTGTPLADLLPVAPDITWLERPTTVTPTEAGLRHPVCRIDESPQAVVERWRGLPPMRGACRMSGLKPAAQVLAASGEGEPMIVGQAYGAGRVLLLGFDSTWQWCMQREEGTRYHRRFWREVILWLANRRPAVWIAAGHPRYQLPLILGGQQRVEVRAGLDSPITGQTIQDAQLEARMVLPDGQNAPLVMIREGDHYKANAEPKANGTYKLELIARSGDREIGRATGQFIVESPDLEMIHPLADFETLRELAGRTEPAGGRFVTLDGLGAILKQIGTNDYRRRHEEIRTVQLAHEGRWRLWTLICGLLTVEWIIRKRRGLV